MTTPDSIAGFPFYALEFGTRGEALSAPQLARTIAECKRLGTTDLIFLAHGFRCDADDATALYTGLLTTLRANLERAEFAGPSPGRKFAVAGVYWPSQKFRESFAATGTTQSARTVLSELRDRCADADGAAALDRAGDLLDAVETSRSAQDRFVASVLPACGNGSDDPLEGLPLLHQWPGSELLDRLRTLDAGRDPEAEGGIETIPLVAPVLGGVGAFLNFMSWSAMKSLAGTVGENGLAAAIRTCQEELGAVGKTRIHLAGHSLGGRLMAASCKALARQGALPVASLSLLEAAFSHYGFSPEAGWGEPGFFREVLESRIVAGAVLSTFSKLDTVVGTAYAVASRLACDRLRAIGDAADPYGGIGHNGAQRTPEAVFEALHDAGVPYQFRAGVPTCLDGSSGTITGHGDITNREVTYAIASAIGRAA